MRSTDEVIDALLDRFERAREKWSRARERWDHLSDNQHIGIVFGLVLLVFLVIWLGSVGGGSSQGSKAGDQAAPAVQPATPPPPPAPVGPTREQVSAYQVEYYTCGGITLADIKRDYGFSQAGMMPEEVILKMENETYGESPEEQYAYEGCLDAYFQRRPQYPIRN